MARRTFLLALVLLLPAVAFADAEDDIKAGLKLKKFRATDDKRRDTASPIANLVVLTTTDGPMTVKPGQVRYFQIKKDHDVFTKDGGWYWKCAGSPGKTRLKGAEYIKVDRDYKGNITWTKI